MHRPLEQRKVSNEFLKLWYEACLRGKITKQAELRNLDY